MIQCICFRVFPISFQKKTLQSGEWFPLGSKTAGFGIGIGQRMEAREDSGPGNGWEFGDDEMGIRRTGQPDFHISLSSFCSVWTTCTLRPCCGGQGCCCHALALAGQPEVLQLPRLWGLPHQ